MPPHRFQRCGACRRVAFVPFAPAAVPHHASRVSSGMLPDGFPLRLLLPCGHGLALQPPGEMRFSFLLRVFRGWQVSNQ